MSIDTDISPVVGFTVFSMSPFNFQIGSTTSTICSVLWFGSFSGSSIPIVIVFAKFLFPDKSAILFAGIVIDTGPL